MLKIEMEKGLIDIETDNIMELFSWTYNGPALEQNAFLGDYYQREEGKKSYYDRDYFRVNFADFEKEINRGDFTFNLENIQLSSILSNAIGGAREQITHDVFGDFGIDMGRFNTGDPECFFTAQPQECTQIDICISTTCVCYTTAETMINRATFIYNLISTLMANGYFVNVLIQDNGKTPVTRRYRRGTTREFVYTNIRYIMPPENLNMQSLALLLLPEMLRYLFVDTCFAAYSLYFPKYHKNRRKYDVKSEEFAYMIKHAGYLVEDDKPATENKCIYFPSSSNSRWEYYNRDSEKERIARELAEKFNSRNYPVITVD